jgi:hypothetical protein
MAIKKFGAEQIGIKLHNDLSGFSEQVPYVITARTNKWACPTGAPVAASGIKTVFVCLFRHVAGSKQGTQYHLMNLVLG